MARVLVVDDEQHARNACRLRLRLRGHQVTCAEGESEAKDLLSREPFDVVVADMNMEHPESGLRLLEFVTQLPKGHVPEVVIMTAFGEMPNLARALELGAFSYVPKNAPGVDEHELLAQKVQEASIRKVRRGVIHDMANVLMGLGLVDVFPDEELLTERQQRALHSLRRAIRSAQELHHLAIGSLRGAAAPWSRLDPEKLLHRVESLAFGIAGMKEVQVETPAALDLPSAQGEPTAATRVLLNFVTNAIDVSQPGQVVELTAEAVGSSVRLAVTDSGPGIPADVRARIFEPGFTTKRSDGDQTGGSGIGLSDARELARDMDGQIEVDTEVGRGSTFTLVLPAWTP